MAEVQRKIDKGRTLVWVRPLYFGMETNSNDYFTWRLRMRLLNWPAWRRGKERVRW